MRGFDKDRREEERFWKCSEFRSRHQENNLAFHLVPQHFTPCSGTKMVCALFKLKLTDIAVTSDAPCELHTSCHNLCDRELKPPAENLQHISAAAPTQ